MFVVVALFIVVVAGVVAVLVVVVAGVVAVLVVAVSGVCEAGEGEQRRLSAETSRVGKENDRSGSPGACTCKVHQEENFCSSSPRLQIQSEAGSKSWTTQGGRRKTQD